MEAPAAASYEKLIGVSVSVNRRKGMSEEEFNRYWAY